MKNGYYWLTHTISMATTDDIIEVLLGSPVVGQIQRCVTCSSEFGLHIS